MTMKKLYYGHTQWAIRGTQVPVAMRMDDGAEEGQQLLYKLSVALFSTL